MGNFGEIMENAKNTAMNLIDSCKEQLPAIQESVQEKIPYVQNGINQTIKYVKRPFVSEEDRAEIFVLNNDNTLDPEIPEDTQIIPPINQSIIQSRAMINPSQLNKSRFDAYLEHAFKICNENGEVEPYDDFSPNAWKQFYPPNHPFFLWEKGYVIPNQTRVYNPTDYRRLAIYQGDLSPDLTKPNGFGVMTTPFYVRIGEWREGKFTGWGREIRRNGRTLEGRFINGLLNGKGILSNAKGKYIGDFVNGKRHGEGKLMSDDFEYDGEFKNDFMDGNGKITFLKAGSSYEGEFRQSQINGHGTYTWQNGNVYTGMMQNGTMHGYGSLRSANGEVYDGQFVRGIKRGIGKITSSDGKILNSTFINGHPESSSIIGNESPFPNGQSVGLGVTIGP